MNGTKRYDARNGNKIWQKKNLYGNVHRVRLFVDYFISSMEKVLCIGTRNLGVRCSVFGMFHAILNV